METCTMKSRIAELETENAGLREALESANRLIEADTEMHAKDVEKSTELIKLAKENERLRKLNEELLAELMNYCSECCGNGSERCAFYNKDGDMCRMAWYLTCGTWMTICRATGHDPATPWEVKP